MGLFERLKKKSPSTTAKTEDTATSTPAVAKQVEALVGAAGTLTVKMSKSGVLLTTPRVSEKAAALASKGTYVFNVPVTANKIEIRKAVEALYKVKVESVHVIRGMGKRMTRGRISGRRANWKKALVTLKKGEKLDVYEGV
ncbi:MAG: 50S ribosomal protein L23 [Patescibacteria group bacterium]